MRGLVSAMLSGIALVGFFYAPTLGAAEPLFPTPLHLTREITEPISGETFVIDEYCAGNRVVSIAGDRTSIADYAKQELIVIDRTANTYSITPFDLLAKSRRGVTPSAMHASARTDAPLPEIRSLPSRGVAGRTAEVIMAEIERGSMVRRIEIALDPELQLSRDALEVLIGAAWPNGPDETSEIVFRASRVSSISASSATASGSRHRLPLEQISVWEIDGERIELGNRVSRVGIEPPPADRITIPPGAARVELDAVKASRLLEELDRLPGVGEPR